MAKITLPGFANPTIGLTAHPGDTVLLPLTDDQILALEALASDPACRVIIALAADHAARNGAIRHLTVCLPLSGLRNE